MKNLFLIVLLIIPFQLWAQATTDETGKIQMVIKPNVKKTVYNFDDVDIRGKIKRPEGQTIFKTPELQFQRLLKLDESFIPRIFNAIDEY